MASGRICKVGADRLFGARAPDESLLAVFHNTAEHAEMSFGDDPRNAPVVKQIANVESYRSILSNKGIRCAKYLLGDPEPDWAAFYEEGMWHPQASDVRYSLLCLSLKNPIHEHLFWAFCDIHTSTEAVCRLSCFHDSSVVKQVL